MEGTDDWVVGAPNGNRGQADKKHRGGGAMSENSGSCIVIQMR